MIGQSATCALVGCGNTFTKTTGNQKFCSPECCRIQTNANIIAQYHEKAAIKKGKKRVCKVCKDSVLSRYNETGTCAGCSSKKKNVHSGRAAAIAAQITWA